MNRAERRRQARNGQPPIAGLWVSNAAWAPTGYGTQTKQVVSRMMKLRKMATSTRHFKAR